MKNPYCITTICFISVALCLGCSGDQDARKQLRPEFQSLEYPKDKPVILRESPIEEPARKLSLFPPSGAGILVRVIRSSKIVTGIDSATGMLTTVSDSLLKLVTNIPDTITIGVTLPAGLHLKQIGTQATLIVKDLSSPAGADQDIEVSTGPQRSLYLRYIWKTSARSMNVGSRGGNVTVVQDSLPQDSINRITKYNLNILTAVKTFLKSGNQTVHVPVGQVITLGSYKAYVQSGLYQGVSNPGSDARKGYVLRAIVLHQ